MLLRNSITLLQNMLCYFELLLLALSSMTCFEAVHCILPKSTLVMLSKNSIFSRDITFANEAPHGTTHFFFNFFSFFFHFFSKLARCASPGCVPVGSSPVASPGCVPVGSSPVACPWVVACFDTPPLNPD